MRPERLEVAGFTAFREPTVVDFRNAEVFAFTGPTGSGKSSLIDAVVFSLYGSVPRYADKRTVAPLISLGKLEARVRFDFIIDDDAWTVVRVVRRNPKGGASTEEARLERGDEVVAGTADEVTEAVEALLGLEYDHFTKSVVLPQGDFARFLHDRPAGRQSLLRSLLDLEVLSEIRELANEETARWAERLQGMEARQTDLAFATPEAKTAAERRVRALTQLHNQLAEAEPRLEQIIAKVEAAEQLAAAAIENTLLLSELDAPTQAPDLAASDRRAATAEAKVKDNAEQVAAAEARRLDLGDRTELTQLMTAAEELEGLNVSQAEAADRLEKLEPELAAARETTLVAGRDLRQARRALEKQRSLHAAHALVADLREGKACPVCAQVVTEIPEPRTLSVLRDGEEALRLAEEAQERTNSVQASVREKKTRLEAQLSALSERAEGLKSRLAQAPERDEMVARLEALEEADAGLVALRKAATDGQEALAAERARRDETQAQIEEMRKDFDRARDRVAKLEPPSPDRDNVLSDWQELISWASGRRTELEAATAEADQTAATLRTEAARLSEQLDEMLVSHGIDPGDGPTREKMSFHALAGARHELDSITEAAEELEKTRKQIEIDSEHRAVAELLALHLRADRFESWLLDEALSALVAGANDLLAELSEGAYSLKLSERKFEVVDHRNADETRSVRTLSGGETFLVSLSLALSLAEQLRRMSSRGGLPIETIFLDEGFGTLDGETLETVGAVIHELGARGRTVGIVTHVPALAEQVPVRFEVAKGVKSATVTRVEA